LVTARIAKAPEKTEPIRVYTSRLGHQSSGTAEREERLPAAFKVHFPRGTKRAINPATVAVRITPRR